MFDITKTTFNMAKHRNLELTIEKGISHDGADLLCIWELDDSVCEWMCSYRLGEALSWNGNIYLPVEIKEELPAMIHNETQLRSVIQFIAASLHFSTSAH